MPMLNRAREIASHPSVLATWDGFGTARAMRRRRGRQSAGVRHFHSHRALRSVGRRTGALPRPSTSPPDPAQREHRAKCAHCDRRESEYVPAVAAEGACTVIAVVVTDDGGSDDVLDRGGDGYRVSRESYARWHCSHSMRRGTTRTGLVILSTPSRDRRVDREASMGKAREPIEKAPNWGLFGERHTRQTATTRPRRPGPDGRDVPEIAHARVRRSQSLNAAAGRRAGRHDHRHHHDHALCFETRGDSSSGPGLLTLCRHASIESPWC